MLSGYVEDTPDHFYYWLLQMIYQLDTIELCQKLIVHLHLYMYLYHSIYLTCIYIYSVFVFTPKKQKTYTSFEVQLIGHGTHFDGHKIPATPTSSSCKEAAPFTLKKRASHIFNPTCIFNVLLLFQEGYIAYIFFSCSRSLQFTNTEMFCFVSSSFLIP